MNSYLSLDTFKGEGIANLEGEDTDARILQMLESISRQVDGYTLRRFFSTIETRYLSGNGRRTLWLPPGWDLIEITSLKEDENGDSVHEITWAETDYFLGPYDADPTGSLGEPRPYYQIEANRLSNSTKSVFGRGQRQFEIVGKWGYSEKTEATGAILSGAMNDSTTTLTVDKGSLLSVGDTLMIDDEQMYVKADPVSNVNQLTVARGVNGTTAASHDDETDVRRIVYPAAVVEAMVIQASQSWVSRASGHSADVGFMETGTANTRFFWDMGARQLLDTVKLVGIG